MTTQKPECSLAKAAESVRIALKPVGFFNYNPTMDVPPSNQTFNQSKLYDRSARTHRSPSCLRRSTVFISMTTAMPLPMASTASTG
jgi:hypothetical protein